MLVTGIRASLKKSLDVKRDSQTVVDVITSEDVGKFPDKNIAEALQRVSGVSISREYGEGERVSIRGTGAQPPPHAQLNGHGPSGLCWTSWAAMGACGYNAGGRVRRTLEKGILDPDQGHAPGAAERGRKCPRCAGLACN